MRLTVALAAEEAAGLQTLKLLTERGHRVVAVFSDSVGGDRGATVASVASKLEVPVRSAAEVRDPALADDLRSWEVDLVLNVHSLYIIDARVLAVPGLGAYNLHPGPLPERAGLNAPSWALYLGDESHGVTLHRMTPEVDDGPIAFEARFPVAPGDTALAVATECVRRGLPLVEHLLDHAERGEPIPAHEQHHAGRRWFDRGPPERGSLSWDRPARRVADFVRACDYGPFPSPWGFPRCAVSGKEVAIAAAEELPSPADAEPGTVGPADGGSVLVAAEDAWVRVEKLEVEGRRIPAAEAMRPGDRVRPLVENEQSSAR
jgi:UDP-4-amino-4-deoxy-L-arabinose formyltransferase/UDP-glucuronic acid dehydrogenase (UDP-4-keto-hexauronic acid decarboxylating)